MISTTLTRKFYCNNILDNTPLCVLEEIAKETGDITKLPTDIDEYFYSLLDIYDNIPVEKKTYNVEQIARFINPEFDAKQWRWESLTRAAQFFMQCASNPEKIPSFFEVGFQTPNKPYRVNIFMLYLLCQKLEIPTTIYTTKEELEKSIKLYRDYDDRLLLKQFLRILKVENKNELIAVLARSSIGLPEKDFTSWNGDFNSDPVHKITLEDSKLEIFMARIAQSPEMIEAENNIAAVILTAVRYQFDISYAKDPLMEYLLIEKSGFEQYVPEDPWMKFWYTKNPALFDLKKTFNPWFPKSFYLYNRLGEVLLNNETVIVTNIAKENIHSELEKISKNDNVYEGIYPRLLNEKTPILLENVNEISNENLLTFTVFRENSVKRWCITKDEIKDYLLNRYDFISPFNSDIVLSEQVIRKLGKILNDATFSSHIEKIQAIITSNNEILTTFAQNYARASLEIKEKVQESLQCLIDLSMYMRGWDGVSFETYPVTMAITPPEFYDQLQVNVTETIQKIENLCVELGDVDILKLPLMCYRDKGYVTNTNEADGLSIGERLEIVKGGEDSENEASCIRISSNWFAASAHRLMEQLSLKPPFDVRDLRYVL